MKTSALKLYALPCDRAKTYAVAGLFIAGNILLPQLCHLIPNGGATWLPIYLFTLICAYKYGWAAGLMTALISPAVNALLFGMPAAAALPVVEVKSVLLALAAGAAASRWRKASLPLLAGVILCCQIPGSLFEWLWTGSPAAALQDFRVGLPGMALQLFGGWLILNRMLRG